MSYKIRGEMARPIVVLESLILLCAIVIPALAQKRSDSSAAGGAAARRDAILIREDDLRNRELRMRLLREPGKTKAPTEQNRKLILNQIFEDFEHIQIVSAEMMRAATEEQNCKHISETAEEINKRGKRLKTNLAIPDPDREKKDLKQVVASDSQQLRAAVLTLNRLIKSFVTNPLFKDPRVTDAKHLAKVRQDLGDIIELSQTVRKSAEKLRTC